jgi:hypothetical protein
MIPILKEGKNKYKYGTETFDSPHEIYFYWYLEELFVNNFIELLDIGSEECDIHLTDKLIFNNKVLLRESNYTCDFNFQFNEKAIDIFLEKENSKRTCYFKDVNNSNTCYVDVKNPYDKQGTKTLFSFKQKMIYNLKKIFVQEVEFQELFYQTFTPVRYLWSDSAKNQRSIPFKVTSLVQFIERKL